MIIIIISLQQVFIQLHNHIDMFKVFQTSNGKKFLNKAKQNKNKRQEEIKKNTSVIILQKNIRAFLTSRRFSNQHYPLLIRNLQNPNNIAFLQCFWEKPNNSSFVLKNHFLRLTISSLQQQIKLKVQTKNFTKAIIQYNNPNKDLSVRQYEVVISIFSSKMDSFSITLLAKRQNFKKALQKQYLTNFHKLIDIISQISDTSIVNQFIHCYQQYQKSRNKIETEQHQSEQRILKSYYKTVQTYHRIIQQKSDENQIIYLLSNALDRMKKYYTTLILNKYNIDVNISRSPDLQDQVQQIFREKREWQQYSFHLYHVSNMMEHMLQKFLRIQSNLIVNALTIIIQVTKLTGNFINIKISKQEFLTLVQRLDNNRSFYSRQQQNIKNYQLLFTIITLQKYLQNLNDLQFIKLFQYDVNQLQKLIKNCLVKYMKSLASFNSQQHTVHQIIKHSISWMNNLYNKIFRTNLLKTSLFQDSSLTIFEGNYIYSQYGNKKYLKELMNIVERSPYLLPIQTRFLMFKKMVREDRHEYGYHAQQYITIRRGKQFQNAFDQLHNKDIRNNLRIRFINDYGLQQAGVDAGGLTKQFLNRIFRIAFDPRFGMFIQNGKKDLMPNPQYEKIQDGRKAQQYEFIGKLLGKSLYQNIMLGIKFAGPFLNLLLNKKNTFDDLLQIDPDLYKSLAYIVSMQQQVQSLQLTFQYQDNLHKKIVNLLPGGDKIKVNQKNKMEYINLLINYKVNRSFQRQTRYIRKGLRSIIHQSWIQMFNYAQFNYLLSGTGVIDVRDWIDHTHVHGADKQTIRQFWEIVLEFTEQQKSLLLKFVTSCERPSFLGFKDLRPPFTIRLLDKQKDKLPVSHTCSNVLDLPQYSSKKIMKEKILYAIKSGAGFQMA